MEMQYMTWMEVEDYLQTRKDIIMPIGSTEQHGPNGLIGTDALTGHGVAVEVGKQLEALVAPTQNIGMALHHMDFPGSMSFKPSTMIAVLKDSVCSLARNGFRRFYFINGHGGNIATAKAAFSEIYEELETKYNITDVKCTFDSWFINPEVLRLCQELYGDGEGYHATPSEVSLTQHLYPKSIKDAKGLKRAPKIDDHDIYGSKQFRLSFPDGRMGSDSALANPEDGIKILQVATSEITKKYKVFAGLAE